MSMVAVFSVNQREGNEDWRTALWGTRLWGTKYAYIRPEAEFAAFVGTRDLDDITLHNRVFAIAPILGHVKQKQGMAVKLGKPFDVSIPHGANQNVVYRDLYELLTDRITGNVFHSITA